MTERPNPNSQQNFCWEPWVAVLTAILLVFTIHDAVQAASIHVHPEQPLQQAVDQATAGDTLLLSPGTYAGNLLIDKPLTLQGEPGTVLDAQGQGDTIRIRAPKVSLIGLTIRRSGHDLTAMNAGIFVEKTAADVSIRTIF